MDEAKRDAILEAATEIFVTKGYRGASIDEIAKAAGVAKGTTYLYCESKADLFYQCVHRDLQAWAAQTARYVDPRKPASDIIRRMAEAGPRYLSEHPLVRGLMGGAHAGLLPDWAERFDQLRTMGRGTLAEVLRIGIRNGEFRPDLDVDEIAGVLQDLTHAGYVLYGERWGKDPVSAERRVQAAMDLALHGLAKT